MEMLPWQPSGQMELRSCSGTDSAPRTAPDGSQSSASLSEKKKNVKVWGIEVVMLSEAEVASGIKVDLQTSLSQ